MKFRAIYTPQKARAAGGAARHFLTGGVMQEIKAFWITVVNERGEEYICPVSIEELKEMLDDIQH